jgi:hypothetical protein
VEKIPGMNFFVHPEAENEFGKAIEYYEEIESSLGYDFAGEVYLCIQRTGILEIKNLKLRIFTVFHGYLPRSN